MATLHIVRGLPGSGKSTFAKKLAAQLGCKHFEADMFFTDKDGNYKWDREKLSEAHEWCHDSAMTELESGRDVVVSNTFTRPYTIGAYVYDMDLHSRANQVIKNPIVIYEMTGQFGNIHGVSEEDLQRMRKSWTSNEELIALIECGEIRWGHADLEFRTINP